LGAFSVIAGQIEAAAAGAIIDKDTPLIPALSQRTENKYFMNFAFAETRH